MAVLRAVQEVLFDCQRSKGPFCRLLPGHICVPLRRMCMKKALVCGAGGFIGGHPSAALHFGQAQYKRQGSGQGSGQAWSKSSSARATGSVGWTSSTTSLPRPPAPLTPQPFDPAQGRRWGEKGGGGQGGRPMSSCCWICGSRRTAGRRCPFDPSTSSGRRRLRAWREHITTVCTGSRNEVK